MIWHSFVLSMLVLDLASVILVLAAFLVSVRVFFHWDPQSSDRDQIRLERQVEGARAKTRWALAVSGCATLVLVVAVSNVMPRLIPGAMCGSGVMEAAGGLGDSVLLWRCLTLLVLYYANVLYSLDGKDPHAPFVVPMAGLSALAAPYAILGTVFTVRAILSMDLLQPVSCCTRIYDWVRSSDTVLASAFFPDAGWIGLALLGWALICVFGAVLFLAKGAVGVKCAGMLALSSLCWIFAAKGALVKVLSAYYYQVLEHHCPWCLFLAEHSFAGFALFGLLCVVAVEGPLAFVIIRLAKKYGGMPSATQPLCKQAAFRAVLASTTFMMLAGLPAALWRVRYGVWMNG